MEGGIYTRWTDGHSSSYIEKQKPAWGKSEWDGPSQCVTSKEIGSFAQTVYVLTKDRPNRATSANTPLLNLLVVACRSRVRPR
jgi:hypothetical protein